MVGHSGSWGGCGCGAGTVGRVVQGRGRPEELGSGNVGSWGGLQRLVGTRVWSEYSQPSYLVPTYVTPMLGWQVQQLQAVSAWHAHPDPVPC